MKNIISKRRIKLLSTAFCIVGSSFAFAQSNYFSSSRNWAFNKKEVYFGISGTGTLGDLGGAEGPGRQLSPRDLNIPATRFGGNAGFRYRFAPRFATKTNLNVALFSADDALSKEVGRQQRNLHFRSLVVELSQQLEFIFWYSENIKSSRKSMSRYFNNSSQAYLFAGFGAFYYNPKAEYNGDWVALRPLGTEGQNMPLGPEAYEAYSFSVPVGIGFKTTITPYWRIGIEFAFHKTFTDYLDDVSGRYYFDFAELQAANPLSAALANRHLDSNFKPDGKRRGNSDENDAMGFVNIHMIYNLSYKKGPKRARMGRGMKTKF